MQGWCPQFLKRGTRGCIPAGNEMITGFIVNNGKITVRITVSNFNGLLAQMVSDSA